MTGFRCRPQAEVAPGRGRGGWGETGFRPGLYLEKLALSLYLD